MRGFLDHGTSRGDLATLYFTDDPLVSPHFFRRTSAGWVMDILADVSHFTGSGRRRVDLVPGDPGR
jgi:hypothetical protein